MVGIRQIGQSQCLKLAARAHEAMTTAPITGQERQQYTKSRHARKAKTPKISRDNASMSTAPVFPSFPLPKPPDWLMHELQQRVVLLLNHVLQQEPQAVERLLRQKGQVAGIESAWVAMKLIVTPAGLLNLAPADAKADLSLKVLDSNPMSILQTLLKGDKPRMEISGDVMLAAEVNWLVDHVRWDVEEDLSRIVGDVPAHGLMQALRGLSETLKKSITPNAVNKEESTPAA
jgi:ubiquinone biosynthesis accessory factor UbiJ